MVNKILNYKPDTIILVTPKNIQNKSTAILTMNKILKDGTGRYVEIFRTKAYIGKNGVTDNKKEGDGRTPKGEYTIGITFGMHNRKEIELDKSIQYVKIQDNLYWIDDMYSKYYNQLIDITKVYKDWNSAEHLINYPNQYEYGIEIKTNINNIPGKR